ncbi:MAG: MFS transporter [Rhodospirillales bacterium]|nr:MFS transporter [Rhodospirillales bacterium]
MSTVLVVAITTIVQALATMCSVIPAAIAPELALAFGVPASMIGFQVSLIYLGAMATSLVGGTFVKRLGAVRTSQCALGVASVGAVLMTVPLIGILALGSVFIGFGYGLTNPSAAHLLMRVTKPGNRNFIFSLKQTGVPLGGVAAGLAAPSLALAFGWQWALWAGAVVTFAFIFVSQIFRKSWDHDRDPKVALRQNPLGDVGLVWSHPPLRRVSLAAFCFSGVQVSLTTFAVTMLVKDIDFGLVEAGVVLSVVMVAGVMGRILWGAAADKLRDGSGVLMAVGVIAVLSGLLTLTLNIDSGQVVIYGVLMLFGFSAIGWNGVFMAEITRLAPEGKAGSATGGALVPTYAGVLLGPASFAGIFALLGHYTTTFGVFAFLSLTGVFLVYSARRLMAGD